MISELDQIRNKFKEKGLKITPQRMSILEAIYTLNNHPTAENITEFIREKNPNIATGTVYKVLDTLVNSGLVKKVKTDRDIKRYDGIIESHHHLYCEVCDYIEDYENARLDEVILKFFEENKINNFIIEDIKLQINGRFVQHKNALHIK